MKLVLSSIIIFVIFINASYVYGQLHIDTAYYLTTGDYAKGREGKVIITYEMPVSKWTYEAKEGFNIIYRKDKSTYMKGKFLYDHDSTLVKVDSFYYYYENGNLRDRGVYKKDRRVGLWEHYSKDGVLEYNQNYDTFLRTYFYSNAFKSAEGTMKYKEDINGDIYEFSDLKDHEGLWTFFNEKGFCNCKGKFVGNTKHGKWIYNELKNGKTIEVKEYYPKYVANYEYSFLRSCEWK